MNDDIRVASGADTSVTIAPTRHLVPMQVGTAIVYVEQIDTPATVEAVDEIHPVAPSPQEAFEKAGEVLRECVRVVGERVEDLRQASKKGIPSEITVEFSLTFEVNGKQSIIPVFVTAEQKLQTGLKVTAKWMPKTEASPKESGHDSTGTTRA